MIRVAGFLWMASLALVAVMAALLAGERVTRLQFDLVFAVVVGNIALALLFRIGLCGLRAVLPAALFTGGAMAMQLYNHEIRLAPYLAIAVINVFVAYVFARGLLPGREPLILQMIRLTGSGPEGADGFRRFVYRQCWIWTGFGLVTALCGLVAMFVPALRPAAEAAILGSIGCQVAWFIASHQLANRRHGRSETWLWTARTFSQRSLWSALDI